MSDNNHLSISRRTVLQGSAALGLSAAMPAQAQLSSIAARIDASKRGHPLSNYLFGGFIEHIGDLINRSLWSEMLSDRKFYHGVDSKPLPKAAGPFAVQAQKWIPVGPDSSILMDSGEPYVGEHSPLIKLAGAHPRGIAQSGLALTKGKGYTARIVLAADSSAHVSANLIWGAGAGDRQSIPLSASKRWNTVSVRFNSAADTADGRIEITATGSGTMRIGAVSLMPDDNIQGFRADTLALMREMDCKILRMPGGNFISGYDWKNTIGDPDKRPPIMDPAWNMVQPNDVGVDELLQMCKLIRVEPYWCVNTGFGEPRSGAELVEYVNGAATTAMGALRAANGHAEPYGVKYWNVGNEMYGNWQMGHMALKQYVIKHNLFADAMRKVDPSIYIVVPGGFVDEMTTGQGMPDPAHIQVEYGSDRDWAGGMLANCWGKFDALATHTYPPDGQRFDLATGKTYDVKMPLVEWSRQLANRVATMVECWQEYNRRFPKLKEGRVKVFFDEYAYHFQQDLKTALAVAMCFHEFFRHSDFIDMAGYTMGTSWLNYDARRSVISASGRVFQLYNRHFGKIPVAVMGNSPLPPPQFPIGGDQPKVDAGSATYPLDVSAALTSDRKALVVAVVNATEDAHTLLLHLDHFDAATSGRTWSLGGSSVDAQNRVGEPPGVAIAEGSFDTRAALSLRPISINLFEFPVA